MYPRNRKICQLRQFCPTCPICPVCGIPHLSQSIHLSCNTHCPSVHLSICPLHPIFQLLHTLYVPFVWSVSTVSCYTIQQFAKFSILLFGIPLLSSKRNTSHLCHSHNSHLNVTPVTSVTAMSVTSSNPLSNPFFRPICPTS